MPKRFLRERLALKLLMIFSVLILVAIIAIPTLTLLVESFTVETTGRGPVFSFDNYVHVINSPDFISGLTNTIVTSLGATVFAIVMGVTMAWVVNRTNVPWKAQLESLNILGLFYSPLLASIAWTYLASDRIGMINALLQTSLNLSGPIFNIYGIWGYIWVVGLFYAPYAFVFTSAALKSMNPELEEAARVCGTGILRTTRRVTIPLVTPAILSSAIIIFSISAGIFEVPYILMVPKRIDTLATQIYRYLYTYPSRLDLALATGVILLVIAGGAIYVQRVIIRRRQIVTISGRGFRPNIIDIGRWKYVALGSNLALVFVGVILPYITLFLASISSYWSGAIDPRLFTLDNYSMVFSQGITTRAIKNSLFLGVVGATLGVGLAFIISCIVERTRIHGREALDLLTTIPISMPAIVLALGILRFFIYTPLYGTIWLVMIGYLSRFLTYGTRNVSTGLLQMSPELEESSATCGASFFTTFRRILVPLLKPNLFAAWILFFIIFTRELGTSILLYSTNNEVLSVALIELAEYGGSGLVAALAMVQSMILFGGFLLANRLAGVKTIGPVM